MAEIEVGNWQMVSLRGDTVCVLLPSTEMHKEEALVHAAWLVAMADDDALFSDILRAVRST